jgi:hypothetical protein
MQYLLLIYQTESEAFPPGSPEFGAMMQRYGVFTDDLQKSDHLVGGNALENVATATTVRVRDGKTTALDGPFAETKEQLGGYYLVDCDNLDPAIECAAKIPSAEFGSIEVRPVVVYG